LDWADQADFFDLVACRPLFLIKMDTRKPNIYYHKTNTIKEGGRKAAKSKKSA